MVGGYALAVYGHPRYTGDLDFWIGTDPGNAARVLGVLDQFGFGSRGIGKADLIGSNVEATKKITMKFEHLIFEFHGNL